MKLTWNIENPKTGLKPASLMVVYGPFQENLAREIYEAWLSLFPGASVLPLESKTKLVDVLARTGAAGLFDDVQILRLSRLEDGQHFAKKDVLERLAAYLEDPQGGNPLFISVALQDRRKAAWLENLGAVFSKSKQAQFIEIPKLYEKDAATLAGRLSRGMGLKMLPSALQLSVKLTDGLADRLFSELKKLTLYMDDLKTPVKDEDIKAVFDPAVEENTFALLDDLQSQDRARLKLRLEEFRHQQSRYAPEVLLGSLHHLLELLLLCAAAARGGPLQGARGYSQVQAAVTKHKKDLHPKLRAMHPFLLTKHLDLLQRLSDETLAASALELHHLDRVLKGSAHSAADPYDLIAEWLSGLLPVTIKR